MDAEDLSEHVMARMVAYCAFRLHNFSAEPSAVDGLQTMAEHNLTELRYEIPVKLQVEAEHSVLTDACMAPHEWLLTSSGQMLKSDSGSHGDDHFFPGVTAIAWELAGGFLVREVGGETAKNV